MHAALAKEIMLQLRTALRCAVPAETLACIAAGQAESCSRGAHSFTELYEDVQGFKFLGAGYFSACFSHDVYPAVCFKVGLKKEDSGAMYAAWCRDVRVPHIPTIYLIEKFSDMYMVAMPCYRESSSKVWLPDDYNVRDDMYYALNCRGPLPCVEFPDLQETLHRIHDFFKGVASFDIHDGNYMFDDSGNIIITDPVSFTKKEKTPVAKMRKAMDCIRPQLVWSDFRLGRTGVVRNGGTAHLNAIREAANVQVRMPGIWEKLLNRIKGEVNA